jgi:hypothetical protein
VACSYSATQLTATQLTAAQLMADNYTKTLRNHLDMLRQERSSQVFSDP